MLMIGITGVTGKLGSYVADLVDKKGIASIHLARSPERVKEHKSFFRCSEASGSAAYRLYLLLRGR